jgi:hypothetical protein
MHLCTCIGPAHAALAFEDSAPLCTTRRPHRAVPHRCLLLCEQACQCTALTRQLIHCKTWAARDLHNPKHNPRLHAYCRCLITRRLSQLPTNFVAGVSKQLLM